MTTTIFLTELIDEIELLTISHVGLQNRLSDVNIWILEKTFTLDQVNIDLLKSNVTYDAVITEFPVYTEATAYLSHKFKGLGICVLGYFDSPWMNELVGLPDNPSYMISYANGLSDKMDFGQRYLKRPINRLTIYNQIFACASLTSETLSELDCNRNPTPQVFCFHLQVVQLLRVSVNSSIWSVHNCHQAASLG